MNKEEILNTFLLANIHEIITQEEFDDVKKAIKYLQQENQALKKQLEEYKATNEVLSHELTKDKVLQQDCLTTCYGIPIGDIPKLINQQKEFIEYLENEIYSFELRGTSPEYNFENVLKRILLKYKEIIGDDK